MWREPGATGQPWPGTCEVLANTVVEVDRPDRRTRRLQGKSDPVDAEAAARAVLAGTASGCPKAGDGRVEMIRSLRVARRSALKARTQATNQLLALVLTSPERLRGSLRGLSVPSVVRVAARFRPGPLVDPAAATKLALRHLARRHAALSAEIAELDRELAVVVAAVAPALLALPGVGTDVAGALLVAAGDNPERLSSEAAFARLCGVAPLRSCSAAGTSTGFFAPTWSTTTRSVRPAGSASLHRRHQRTTRGRFTLTRSVGETCSPGSSTSTTPHDETELLSPSKDLRHDQRGKSSALDLTISPASDTTWA